MEIEALELMNRILKTALISTLCKAWTNPKDKEELR
jgi:hypothetical protein